MSVKSAKITIGEKRWLTQAEAMAWVGVKSEAAFDMYWKLRLNRYSNGGKGVVYDKRQIDAVMESRLAVEAVGIE